MEEKLADQLKWPPEEIADDLQRFSKDLGLLHEISQELHYTFPGQCVAAYEGIVYVAPTFDELSRIFSENNLPLKFSPWTYLIPEGKRRTIILKN